MPESPFFYRVTGLRPKETLAQEFSCEFYEIFKNTFFTEHTQVTASEEIWNNMFTVSVVVLLLYFEDLCMFYKNLIVT